MNWHSEEGTRDSILPRNVEGNPGDFCQDVNSYWRDPNLVYDLFLFERVGSDSIVVQGSTEVFRASISRIEFAAELCTHTSSSFL